MNIREQFEDWVDSNFPFKKDRFHIFRDEYKSQFTRQLWEAWQEASKASEQQLAAVVAENAGLSKRIEQLIDIINNADNDYCMCGDSMESHGLGGCGHSIGMFDYHYGKWLESGNETPSTDAYLAEVRGQGVEDAASIADKWIGCEGISSAIRKHAAQLRQGAEDE